MLKYEQSIEELSKKENILNEKEAEIEEFNSEFKLVAKAN